MRFTIGLRRRTVKGKVEKNPVFQTETGFFIGARMTMGNLPLKVAASISLGIHLLFFGIASSLFQESKTLPNPAYYVKVTLFPLVAEEKPDAKIIPPVPLKVQTQEGEEPVFGHLGLNRETTPPPKSMAKNISLEEPKPILKNEEEETSNDPMNTANAPGSVSDTDSNVGNEGNMASSREATSMGGDLSVALPSLRSGESYGGAFSFRSSGEGQGSGTGPGNGGSDNGGSGKGTGVFGKFFYAHKGGNGARPRYAENPKPIYPQEAREKGYEGEVVLRAEVLSNGRVGQIEVRKSSGYELLDHSALTTVKQWRFIPAKKGDIAIPLWVNIPIKFQLQ
jgi:TonB family protein